MAPINDNTLRALEAYLQRHDGIELYTPRSPEYEDLRESFVIRPARPFAIVRPQTAADVQASIQFILHHDVDFNIRSGGHDSAGRSQIDGGLLIDMRDLDYFQISKDRTRARVGGGIQLGRLAELLGKQDLITPTGSVASVGYTGWSTLGGYGPFSSLYGLGVDQIVGAKLVNSNGEIIEASDELLAGLRGGGGNFGVVVELTINVYPLKQVCESLLHGRGFVSKIVELHFQAEILASTLIYNSTDMLDTWTLFSERYDELQQKEGIPDALQVQQFAMEYPGFGKALPFHQFVQNQEAVTPWPAYGRSHSISLKEFTLKSLAVLANYSSLLPGGGVGLAVHELRHPKPNDASVFGNRLHHHMLEILSVTTDQDYVESGEQWALGLEANLRKEDPTNILGGYISLMDDDETDLKLVYGKHYETLLGLKREYDPRNTFRYAIPRLPA
ncbi:hypothetical protein BJX99DRAFT_260019 [Aspergillus californicus]